MVTYQSSKLGMPVRYRYGAPLSHCFRDEFTTVQGTPQASTVKSARAGVLLSKQGVKNKRINFKLLMQEAPNSYEKDEQQERGDYDSAAIIQM